MVLLRRQLAANELANAPKDHIGGRILLKSAVLSDTHSGKRSIRRTSSGRVPSDVCRHAFREFARESNWSSRRDDPRSVEFFDRHRSRLRAAAWMPKQRRPPSTRTQSFFPFQSSWNETDVDVSLAEDLVRVGRLASVRVHQRGRPQVSQLILPQRAALFVEATPGARGCARDREPIARQAADQEAVSGSVFPRAVISRLHEPRRRRQVEVSSY